uniref:hypothetical protein n=1 Tax=uncultured Draconibacterium sp. TaxID=1573823 RepID=UPI003217AEC2
MKTIVLTFAILVLSVTAGFCQSVVINVEEGGHKKNENSLIVLTYYFRTPSIEPSVFQKDTVVVLGNNINSDFPRIELYENLKFCFFYNITSEKHERISFDSGERFRQTDQSSNIMTGDYEITQGNDPDGSVVNKRLTLHFENGDISSYKITEYDKEIMLVKQ